MKLLPQISRTAEVAVCEAVIDAVYCIAIFEAYIQNVFDSELRHELTKSIDRLKSSTGNLTTVLSSFAK